MLQYFVLQNLLCIGMLCISILTLVLKYFVFPDLLYITTLTLYCNTSLFWLKYSAKQHFMQIGRGHLPFMLWPQPSSAKINTRQAILSIWFMTILNANVNVFRFRKDDVLRTSQESTKRRKKKRRCIDMLLSKRSWRRDQYYKTYFAEHTWTMLITA